MTTASTPDGTFAPSHAPHVCPRCGFVTRSALFAGMHRRSCCPTPQDEFALALSIAAERSMYRAEVALVADAARREGRTG